MSHAVAKPLKQCAMCKRKWGDLRELVEDRSLELNGYQAHFEDPSESVLVMTHNVESCHSTIGLPAVTFACMYRGPAYSRHNRGNPECPGKCLVESDLTPCNNECAMRWVREVMQLLQQHRIPKGAC